MVRPSLALVAVVSVGLGVGSLTAVYGITRSLLDQDMTAVQRSDGLVSIYFHAAQYRYGSPSYAHYTEFHDLQDVFSEMTEFSRQQAVISTDEWAERMNLEMTEGNYFGVLGVAPALGRVLGPDDDEPGAARVVMLGYDVWQDHYAGDPDILDRPLRVNGDTYRIVGILPQGFIGLTRDWVSPPQVWVTLRPFTSLSAESRRSNLGPIIARLRPGESVDSANARLALVPGRLSRDPADVWEINGIEALPVAQTRVWPGRRAETSRLLNMLAVVAGLILLTASFNVANFLIARFSSRRQELATRLALGATRARIARALLAEAVLIALGAGLVSLLVSVLLLRWLSQVPSVFLRIQLALESGFDMRFMAIAVMVLVASTISFGLIPAILISVQTPFGQLKHTRAQVGWNTRRFASRQMLLTGQIALAVVLTVTAGLYVRSFAKIAELDPGYSTESILLTNLLAQALTREERMPFYRTLFSRLEDNPNVVAATIGSTPPFTIGRGFVELPGDPNVSVEAGATAVAPRFFETQGVGLVAGREFRDTDDPNDGVILNSVLAEELWPQENAIGRSIRLNYEDKDRVVMGVVGIQRCRDMKDPPSPCYWVPFSYTSAAGYLRIRTRGDPMAFLPELRRLLNELHPDAALAYLNTVDGHLARLIGADRTSAVMAGANALLGILMVAASCFSVLLSMVRESAREIAIRLAIGATPAAVTRQVVARAILFAVVGAGVGAVGAFLVGKMLATQLFGVSPTDYRVFLLSVLGIIVIAALCSYWPARYAAGTDPATTLKYE